MDLAFSHFSVKKNSSIQCRTINGIGKYLFAVYIFQIYIVLSDIYDVLQCTWERFIYLLYLCKELSSCLGVFFHFSYIS